MSISSVLMSTTLHEETRAHSQAAIHSASGRPVHSRAVRPATTLAADWRSRRFDLEDYAFTS